MEHGSAIGTYAAYAIIGVFLLILTAAVVRTLMIPVALVLLPLARRAVGSGNAAAPLTRTAPSSADRTDDAAGDSVGSAVEPRSGPTHGALTSGP